MERFLTSDIPVYVMAVITLSGILITLTAGIYYQQMIKQTENMLGVRYAFLQQIKNKFENTYRLNKGIEDISLFVDRQLKESRILLMSTETAGKASLKAACLCLLLGTGLYVLQGMFQAAESEMSRTITVTAVCVIAGFSIHVLSDVADKRERLCLQLTEYCVNTFAKRLDRNSEDEKYIRSESDSIHNRKVFRRKPDDDMRISRTKAENDRKVGRINKDFEQSDMGPDDDGYNEKIRDHEERKEKTMRLEKAASDQPQFSEDDLQYLRQSLERLAAGREKNASKKHKFTSEDEAVVDEILREYFE